MQTTLIILSVVFILLVLPLLSRDLRRRMFAKIYDRVTMRHEGWLASKKSPLLAEIRGRVLEIGPGTGVNFRYFPKDIEWIGLEPNPHMHAQLRAKAQAAGLPCECRSLNAGDIDMRDDEIDCVLSTLVLCSVSDPEGTLQEIRRVLKPGGTFIFLEHVAAPAGSKIRRWQRRIRPLWSLLADGCCPDRELDRLIRKAGFAKVEIEEFRVPKSIAPSIVAPHIVGRAYK